MSVGNLDPLFGDAGQVILAALGTSSRSNDLVVLRDGIDTTADSILLAGGAGGDFFVSRLNPDGTLDSSTDATPGVVFGIEGTRLIDFGGEDEAFALAVQADGSIVVAGVTGAPGSRNLAVARLLSDGSLDNTFNGTGLFTLDLVGDDVLTGLVVLADGTILLGGTTTGAGGRDVFVARLDAGGALDRSFDGDGIAVLDLGGDDEANDLAVQQDGKIVLAGSTTRTHANGTHRDFAVARLLTGGALDGSYGVGGVITIDFGSGFPADVPGTPVAFASYDDVAHSLALVQDGGSEKVVVAGRASNGRLDFLALARLTDAGVLDATFGDPAESFGPAGTVTTAVGPSSDIAFALTVQPNGKLAVAGRALRDEVNIGVSDFALARYLADGTIDTTFGFGGRLVTTFAGGSSTAFALDFGDNGTLVAAGVFTDINGSQAAVARYQADIRPIAQSNSFSTATDGFEEPIFVAPLDNDFDPDVTDTLRITQLRIDRGLTPDDVYTVGDPPLLVAEGVLFSNGTTVSFTPRNGFSGSLTIFYTVTDEWLTVESRIDVNVNVSDARRAGDRDPAFGSPINPITVNGSVTLSDGSVVVAGTVTYANSGETDFVLARYNLDGSLDTTFGGAGFVVTDFGIRGDDQALGIAVQTVGGVDRLVVAGFAETSPNVLAADFAVARYNLDGTLDTTFGIGGRATIDFGGDDLGTSVVIDPLNGGIIIGGVTDAPGGTDQDFALARLNSDGTPDTNFGTGGRVRTDVRGIDILRALAVDGSRVIAVGTADFLAADAAGRDFALARYNIATGLLDTTFDGDDGIVVQDVSVRDELFSVIVQSAGVYLVGGFVGTDGTLTSGYDFVVARFSGAALDNTFGVGGLRTIDFAGNRDEVRSLRLNGTDLYAAGFATGATGRDFAVARLDLTGTVIATRMTDFGGASDTINTLALQGATVVAFGPAIDANGFQIIGQARYPGDLSDEDIVLTQPGGGIVFRQVGQGSEANGVLVQGDGKIVAGGYSLNAGGEGDFTLVRYLEDGFPDSTFGTGGVVTVDLGGDDRITAVLFDGSKILAAGYRTGATGRDFVIARFNLDGSLDGTFGVGGVREVDFFGGDDEALAIAAGTGGNLLLSGYATQNGRKVLALVQLDADGNLVGLDGDGKVTLDLGADAEARGVVVQPDNSIVVAGIVGTGTNADALAARFLADGTPDAGFGIGGVVRIDLGFGADAANDVALDSTGRIVLAGEATTDQGDLDILLVRLLAANGGFDGSFGAGSGTALLREFGSGDDRGLGVVLQQVGSEERIVVVGAVTFDGRSAFGIARRLDSGANDAGFGSNGLLRTFVAGDASANDVVLDASGRIVVAGSAVVFPNDPPRFAILRHLGAATGNFAPLAVDDFATTVQNQPVTLSVLLNDSDANGDDLMITAVSAIPPAQGTVAIDIGGKSITFTPNAAFTGQVTFTYTVSDGTDFATATVTIDVVAAPNPGAALSTQAGLVQNITFISIGGTEAVGVYTGSVNGLTPADGFLQISTGSTQTAVDGTRAGVDNGNRLDGDRLGAFDATIIEIDILVPAGDNFLFFDFAFLTNEFPGLLGRNANDAFIAELDESNWTIDPVTLQVRPRSPDTVLNNFAFDPANAATRQPLSVGNAFFGDRRVVTLTDTLYNGGTSLLRAGVAVTPGAHKLILSVFDVGDDLIRGQIDSAVFLSGLRTMNTIDPVALEGATQGPRAGDDFVALTNAQPGVGITFDVRGNDLTFDGFPVFIVEVNPGSAGTVTTDGLTVTYTPTVVSDTPDFFTYTVADARGLRSTATVQVFTLFDSAITTSSAAPTDTLDGLSTNFVSNGRLMNVQAGSSATVFTLADYTGNPTGVNFDSTRFHDVFAPDNGPTDQVEIIVNDPTGTGQIFYFNGATFQPVRSSGNQPPERLPDGRLRYVLDAFSFPRVNFLVGTVFTIQVPVTNTTTSVSTSTAGGDGGLADVQLRSDVSASLSVSSSQSTVVRASESSLNLRQGLDGGRGDSAFGGRPGAGEAASGAGKKDEESTLNFDAVWLMLLNPEATEMLLEHMADGSLTPEVLSMVAVSPDVQAAFESAGGSSAEPVAPDAGPEEEEQSRTDEFFLRPSGARRGSPDPATERRGQETRAERALLPVAAEETPHSIPSWAWAALFAGPALEVRRRKRRRSGRAPA